jgi:hypothetical protein
LRFALCFDGDSHLNVPLGYVPASKQEERRVRRAVVLARSALVNLGWLPQKFEAVAGAEVLGMWNL